MQIKYLLTISRPLLKMYKTFHLFLSSSAGGLGSIWMAAAQRSTTHFYNLIHDQVSKSSQKSNCRGSGELPTLSRRFWKCCLTAPQKKPPLISTSAFESPPLAWTEIYSTIFLVKRKPGWLYFQNLLQLRHRGVRFLRSKVIVWLWKQPAEMRHCRSYIT